MIVIPVLVIGGLSVLFPLLIWKRQPPPNENAWRGVFYYDPADPSLFVPKRFGIGYTLNFANPWSWVVLGLIFVVVLLPVVLTAISLHNQPR
jgi:uncharacterized membrane protein